ncbi:GNAT family N-acetyltransferase [Devosia sp. BK]|uniref:acyl-homoserine-lactone synthase n=1 Tax=Devosia sp. BK TaxID=2871706 RepID=UPI00293A1403|nr:acyl-homoserine-lactone synthase [Devosia sp. BK]MDV3253410.1 GNAT family N-acetyltransferase [Devosia sp. BK]
MTILAVQVKWGRGMQVHIVRGPVSDRHAALLEDNYRLRHRIFVEQQGWQALRRSDGRDVDAFDNADATHILLTKSDQLVGGSRVTPLDRPNLLQTVFSGLVQDDLPADPSLGADWTRFYVRPDRREGRRRTPESAALFCATMEYALIEGFTFITFVSSLSMVEHGNAVGWRITPLGEPALVDGKATVAAWIEVSEHALDNVRRATGMRRALIPASPPTRGPSIPLYAH